MTSAQAVDLVTVYQDVNYSGLNYTFTASTGCDTSPDIDFSYADLGTWSDRISSFIGHNNCQVTLYVNSNFGGATYGPYTSSTWVGSAMNDLASSMKLS